MSTRWASSHIRAHFPRPTSLLRPENYDFLALNAESGNNVIQFARRSSGCGKRVSGVCSSGETKPALTTANGNTSPVRNGDKFISRGWATSHGEKSHILSDRDSGETAMPIHLRQASPADSSISHKRKNGTYNNGPRHSGKAIFCFVAVFAGFWLGVAAVSAYVHFSGR